MFRGLLSSIGTMAFWGVEVKPGKPFTHKAYDPRARLHVSQATLGIGSATKKSVVQCNVGNRIPTFLCSLFPDKAESCQLNLEFEEATNVVFSVIGPRSVHLTGYFLARGRHCNIFTDESESFGEDIADTESEKSVDDEYDYDDSFINDGDEEETLVHSSASNVSENRVKDKQATNGNRNHRRLKKKYHVNHSDDDRIWQLGIFSNGGSAAAWETLDAENEDKMPISSMCKSKPLSEGTKLERKENGDTKREMTQTEENASERKACLAAKANPERVKQEFGLPTDLDAESHMSTKKKRKCWHTEGKPLEDEKPDKDDDSDEELAVSDGLKNANWMPDDIQQPKKNSKRKNRQNEDVAVTNNLEKSSLSTEKRHRNEMEFHDEIPQARTLKSGLIIEDLTTVESDGKMAISGNKVSIKYVAKLRESGKIVDSNISTSALKFRLGEGKVIEGLEFGVEGMRAGDKRRLTIPPSMAYGRAHSEYIPPNSWLVCEVEVVKVR